MPCTFPRIKRIHLSNFQKHFDLCLEFSPHVNTIVGATDRGKSAILRAIRWVLDNSPSGTGMIKKGEKKAEVTLTLEKEGKELKIKRIRSESENIYKIGDNVYKAFGQGVPDDLRHIFPFHPIHYQAQHDSPFWLLASPGEVARNLNEVVDLDLIDRVLRVASSHLRDKQRDLENLEEEIHQIENQVNALRDVEERRSHLLRIRKIQERRDRLVYTLAKVEKTRKFSELASSLRSQVLEGQRILERQGEYQALSSRVHKLRKILLQLDDLKGSKPPPDFSPIEKKWEEWKELKEKVGEFAKTLGFLRLAKKAMIEAKEDLEKAEKEYRKTVKGQVCPLCGQKIIL